MSIKIDLTADANGEGVDFNQFLIDHFTGYVPYQFPLFLPADGDETTQILHLSTPTEGQEADTRVVLLEGSDFFYTFSNHSVSGTIDQIRLGTLGPAWDSQTEDLVTNADGLVEDMGASVTLSNLNIVNEVGVQGEVHEIVRGFMGGSHSGTAVDADPFLEHVWASAHDVTGSTGNDSWKGTTFGDMATGGDGNDNLSGLNGNDTLSGDNGRDTLNGGNGSDNLKGGNGYDKLYGNKGIDILNGGLGADSLYGGNGKDKLFGGSGKDKLNGGAKADQLTGGNGADTFIFTTASEADGDLIKDFNQGQSDVIKLTNIDADITLDGNQAFTFVGAAGLSGVAGELTQRFASGNTIIEGDIDGDSVADFQITLSGNHTLTTDDFLL
ncbi:hypothetical protein NNA36_19290 [Shimia sp. CNT1-13L.2]|uniref:calcium-binding protein n=1 Tax=Shimia sp. CNT1-13L.2 TaxID=2959663 RepID=UPI0020CFAE68|nr:hypothetical protein [Shimia sp. CNT1-13L.2]MCP9484112.1 hypothetical protein [Shimia sp. CNT1-13L.2]